MLQTPTCCAQVVYAETAIRLALRAFLGGQGHPMATDAGKLAPHALQKRAPGFLVAEH